MTVLKKRIHTIEQHTFYFGMLIFKFTLYYDTHRVDESLCVHCAPHSKEEILYNIKPGGKGGGTQSIMLIAQSSMHIYATATFVHA